MPGDDNSESLLRSAQGGDRAAIEALFEQHRARLRRMVELRLNQRLWGRVDPSDIVQDAMLQAAKLCDQYLQDPQLTPYLWLRTLTQQQLLAVHRFHLRTDKRDAALEVSLGRVEAGVSSASLASLAVAGAESPSQIVGQAEQVRLLEALIDQMDPTDREVLALRHFEQLTNAEVAQVLNISQTAASQRFVRALRRLRRQMRELGLDD